ncbi:hypothetical protein IW147_005584 [Coemansia sp. RSA 720]|nr:hypothetical protein IW147_005584 [Coemansia sp. RSA 720]
MLWRVAYTCWAYGGAPTDSYEKHRVARTPESHGAAATESYEKQVVRGSLMGGLAPMIRRWWARMRNTLRVYEAMTTMEAKAETELSTMLAKRAPAINISSAISLVSYACKSKEGKA